jgi:ADP-heptose:LPS heptosyltransferase
MQPESPIRKVLIYRLGSLGDTIVALPCFHLISRTFPSAERILLTNFSVHAKAPASAEVLAESGLVHGYMRYSTGTRRPGELLSLASRIRRFQPDLLVYLMPVRPLKSVLRDRIFLRMAGVRRVMGIPSEEQLKHRFDPSSGRYEPEASRLARTLVDLGDACVEELGSWSLKLTEAERATAGVALGALRKAPLIACGPGTKMQAKDWGQDNWQALLTRLHAEYPDHGLALVGAREDAEISDYAAQGWKGPKVNLCGVLTPRGTAAALERSRVFLGPDSGPMHLAAIVGTPCVIAFSARGLPGVWFPVGSQHQVIYHQTSCYGCSLETCTVEARRCLSAITVAAMADAVDRVLGRKPGLKTLNHRLLKPSL